MQVKIFKEEDYMDLDGAVNRWLESGLRIVRVIKHYTSVVEDGTVRNRIEIHYQ